MKKSLEGLSAKQCARHACYCVCMQCFKPAEYIELLNFQF